MQLYVFSLYFSESLLYDRIKESYAMLSMHNIISWFYLEKEIEVFCERFFFSTLNKHRSEDSITDNNMFFPIDSSSCTHESTTLDRKYVDIFRSFRFVKFEEIPYCFFIPRIDMEKYMLIFYEIYETIYMSFGIVKSFERDTIFFCKIWKMNERFLFQFFSIFQKITSRKNNFRFCEIEKCVIELF